MQRAIFMQFACNTPTHREEYVRSLMPLVPVDAPGPCLRNREDNRSTTDPQGLTAEYMFSLVLENAHIDSYVTDKLFRALQAGTIPVYRGAADVAKYLPHAAAVINVRDFKTEGDLATYLHEVSHSEELWRKHVAWRSRAGHIDESFVRLSRTQYMHTQCRVCMYCCAGGDPLTHTMNWEEPLSPVAAPWQPSRHRWNKREGTS